MPRVNRQFEGAKEMVGQVADVDALNIMIYSIWAKQLHNNHPLPGFVSSIKKNTLLILGSNPSFNPDGYEKELSQSKYQDIRELGHPNKFRDFMFQFDLAPLQDRNEVLELVSKVCRIDESIGDNGHVYSHRLNKFGIEPTGLNIQQVVWWDMCFLRMNDQTNLDVFLKSNPKLKWTMLLIALRVIEMQEPKMILLPNSGAVRNLQSVLKLFGGSLEFSQTYGTHVLTMGKISCPIFLSSNLHSRNQLDAYSKERYKWHVGWVWEKLNG